MATCRRCDGTGELDDRGDPPTNPRAGIPVVGCHECKGTGEVPEPPRCPECGSKKREKRKMIDALMKDLPEPGSIGPGAVVEPIPRASCDYPWHDPAKPRCTCDPESIYADVDCPQHDPPIQRPEPPRCPNCDAAEAERDEAQRALAYWKSHHER